MLVFAVKVDGRIKTTSFFEVKLLKYPIRKKKRLNQRPKRRRFGIFFKYFSTFLIDFFHPLSPQQLTEGVKI
jgi:hypothetical protein